MQTINLNPQILQEIIELISLISIDFPAEIYNFELTSNSLKGTIYEGLDPNNSDYDINEYIEDWLNKRENPNLFKFELSSDYKTITFTW